MADEPKKPKASAASNTSIAAKGDRDAKDAKAKPKPKAPPPPDPSGEGDPDALMATTLKAMEWASKRKKGIAQVTVAIAAAAGIFAGWLYYKATREEQASALVAKGLAAEDGLIKKGDENPETLARLTFFNSEDEKQKAALAAYGEARAKYGDTGPGILARLGEAGVHLDRGEWDEALNAYTEVRNSSLANADVNVRMRCLEGIGYAREGKGLIDDARRSFEELSNVDAKDAKPLGFYHLARLDYAKGDKDAALNKLKTAREILKNPGIASRFLKEQVEKLMTKIDPNSVPKAPPGMGGMGGLGGMPGGEMTPEMEQLMKQIQAQGMGGQGGAPPPKGP